MPLHTTLEMLLNILTLDQVTEEWRDLGRRGIREH